MKLAAIASLLLIIAILMLGTFKTKAQQKTAALIATQGQERIVATKTDFNPPLKMTLVKTRRGAIEIDKKFSDDDDWFKGLTVAVKNSSDKPVTYIGIEILFRRPEIQGQTAPAGWDLEYGDNPFRYKTGETIPLIRVKPVLPGDAVVIHLSDSDFDQVKLFLKDAKYPSGINGIELRVTLIGFSDGTAWSGRMLRRDPNSPGGWSPVEPHTAKNHR